MTLRVSWTAPSDQGSALLGYKIVIRTSDTAVYAEDLTNCNGQNADILSRAYCDVPIASLRSSAVYNLPWGASVWAKVTAYNKYGNSEESPEGNGARILTIPDAPVSLTETVSQRSATSITFTWLAGAKNGGDPVLDYRVNTDNSNGVWIVLKSNLQALTYTATNLIAGNTYIFQVEARNSYGYSALSQGVSILCATIPSRPAPPTSVVVANNVIISWKKPSENGTPITAYTILIKQADGGFSEALPSCNGATATIRDAMECTVPLSVLYTSPYDLILGQTIESKIIATNNYGSSDVSEVGGTALIVLVPSEPLSLDNNPAITMGPNIGITWTPSAQVGGSAILDYQVWYDAGRGDSVFEIL